MKYVALLRGINVGGNNIVKMSELKHVFAEAGFMHVSTFINSGNVLFETEEAKIEPLTQQIDALLTEHFFPLRTVILSQQEIEQVLKEVPTTWKNDNLRKYIAFLRNATKPEDVIKEVQLKEDIDSIEKGHRAVYMSTKLDGITKSGFTKLSAKKIYQEVTIRNYTTVQKLALLMKS